MQVFSIYLIVNYSKFHQAAFGSIFNNVTGKINSRYSEVQQYFYLRKTNDSLIKANEELYNKLKADFSLPDSTSKFVLDSIHVDSINQFRKYTYLQARVIYNAVSTQSNYIVLNK